MPVRKPRPPKKEEPLSEVEEKIAGFMGKLDQVARWPHRKKKRDEEAVRYASFNDRVFASVIDTALSFVLLAPLLMGMSNIIYGGQRNPLQTLPRHMPPEQQMAYLMQSGHMHKLFMDYTLHFLIFGVIVLWLWNISSATPGKWLLRMRIVDAQTFCKPAPRKLLVRYISYLGSIMPLTLGFAWAMIDKQRRCWHDMIAGTVVVRVDHWRFKDDGTTPHVMVPGMEAEEEEEDASPDEEASENKRDDE